MDLLSAAPGLVLAGLLPGLVLASVIAPRWALWQRVAMAPGLSAGVVGILGLLLHDIHVPFAPQSVLPILAALCAAGTLVARRRGRVADAADGDGLGRRQTRVVVGCGLVAGLVSTVVAVIALSANPLPFDSDSAIHASYAELIARNHDVFPRTPSPVDGGDIVRQRAASEATAAVVSWIGGPRPALSVAPLTLLAVLTLPLGLAFLAAEATGSWRLASLAPLLGIGMPLAHLPMTLGEFPLIIDSTLVVPVVVAVRRAIVRTRVADETAVLAACVAAMLVVHGLELITAAVVGGPLVALTLLRARTVPWRRLLVVAAAALGALVVVTLISRVPSGASASDQTSTSLAPLFLGTLGRPRDVAEVLNSFAQTDLVTPVYIGLYALALVAVLRARRLGWAMATHVLLLAALADVGYTHVLARLWKLLYPWSVADRLASVQYWAVAPLLAFGAVWLWDVVHRSEAPVASDPDVPDLRSLSAPALVAVAGVVASVALAAHADRDLYASLSAPEEVTTPADVAALRAMDATLPPGTVVLDNGEADGGQWINALTRDIEYAPLEYNRSHIHAGSGFATSDRAYALAQACSEPAQAARALAGVSAIYVGARQQPSSSHRWSERCIAALPGVHVALQRTVDGRTATLLTTAVRKP